VAVWFVGAAVVHDLILLPLYSLADLTVPAVLWHRTTRVPQLPWINYLRLPAFLSGVLLLVWFPLIFALSVPYSGATGLSDSVYFGRWLIITGALFGASSVAFASKLRRAHRAARTDEQRPAPGRDAAP
jgi:hypothetical protein